MLLCGSVILLPPNRAFQLDHIQGFAHHRESLAHAFFGRDQFGWSSFPSPFPPRLGSHSFRSMIPKYSLDRLPISRKRAPYLTRLRTWGKSMKSNWIRRFAVVVVLIGPAM